VGLSADRDDGDEPFRRYEKEIGVGWEHSANGRIKTWWLLEDGIETCCGIVCPKMVRMSQNRWSFYLTA
jgi:hypothetical protein